jgi:filamentous hemagglutinin family protein
MILALGSLLLWLSCLSSLGHAQAIPITPSGLNTQVSGPLAVGETTQYNITGGTRPGGGTNLFHSFGEFGVPTNNIANFLNETALPTNNVLARVTGGNVSNILGAIQTEGFDNANLFLMNPAGLLFGPNATLNVGGMVTFTSADYLRLADNARFNAIPNAAADALLSASPVAAFGFLGPNPGAITVHGSQLTVSEGTGLSLVGGNITIQSGTLEDTTVQPAQLSAPGGQLNLASAASPGEILYSSLQTAANVNGQSFTTMGTISISQNSVLDVSSNAAGAVRIRGGQLIADSATISANTTGAGNAGEIVIQAGNASLSGFSLIFSNTTGAGQAGTVRVSAEESISLTESAIFSGTTSTSPTASGGQINLTAPVIDIALAQLNTLTTGPAPAGDITLATNTLNLMQESEVNASTGGLGRSGNITIRGFETGSRAQDVMISGSSFVVSETLGDLGPAGDAGTLLVETARLTMQEGGGSLRTSSRLSSPGNAGTVTVNASESIRVMSGSSIESNSIERSTGNAGGIHITAPVVSVEGTSFLSTSTELTGNAGNITIKAGDFRLASGGQLLSSSVLVDETPTGASGAVTIQGLAGPAQSVVIDGAGSGLFSTTSGTGAGGSITANATQITMTTGGTISAASSGSGTGGSVALTAGTLSLATNAKLDSSTTGAGNAGTIQITTTGNSATIASGSVITSSTTSTGHAGQIVVTTPAFTLDNGTMTTSTSGAGNAGGITVNAGSAAVQGGGQLSSSSTGTATGAAGTITVQGLGGTGTLAQSVTLTNGKLLTSAAGAGAGGNIVVKAPSVTLSETALISATSNSGNAGSLTLTDANTLTSTNSSLTTEATTGAGGSIALAGTTALNLTGTTVSATVKGGTQPGGNITLTAPTVTMTGGKVTAETEGAGPAGSILVNANTIGVTGGAQLSTSSRGAGAGGAVTVQDQQGPAGSLTLSGTDANGTPSGLFSTTSGTGAGGSITANATQITMTTGGTVSAASTGNGNAGSITMTASGPILIDRGVVSTSAQTAQGGGIALTGGSVTLQNHASVSASSAGLGDAGNITINAGTQYLSTDSAVTTRADQASGGNITVVATDMVRLTNSQINTSVAGGSATKGGNITIDPNSVILQNSKILAQAVLGNGGNITITTPLYLVDSTSRVSASSQFGLNGTVTIQSPTSNLSGTVSSLPSSMRQSQALQTGRCAALANSQSSSLIVAGRETIPTEPGGWLPSPFASLNAGDGLGARGEGPDGTNAEIVARGKGQDWEGREARGAGEEIQIVSLRRLTPAGFLTQSFAENGSTGCRS